MKDTSSKWCPSYRCKPRSQLLGVRQDDGTVAILPTPLPIDEEFIETVKKDEMPPEQRFRFTNKCAETGCNQWTGKNCGVVERIVQHMEGMQVSEELPACGIRPKCRWFHEHQERACKICPYIITEISLEQRNEMEKDFQEALGS